MPDHTITKPNLFISHATSDGEFATVIEMEIRKVFADGINVFCTSSPGTIAPSKDWLSSIEAKLDSAQAVIVLVTPTSVERPWLWFEVGASWMRARKDQAAIYPLCAPEIQMTDLPSPLNRLQALSMGKVQDLKLLFQALIDQFGFGSIASFRATNITKRIPKYKDVKVQPIDLDERVFYSGKFTGYSDRELGEVLDTDYFTKQLEHHRTFRSKDREGSIFNGRLIHFREIDRRFDLPPGTSERLLVNGAGRWGLKPELLTENIVRFTCDPDFRAKYLGN
jgi:hypothetical protein